MSAELASSHVGSCFYREWAETPESTTRDDAHPRLRVLSLNILADCLATGGAPSISATPSAPALFADDEYAAGVALLDDEAVDDPGFSFTFRCPADALQWERRWPMLLALMLEQEPDIIGLQEVDLAPDKGRNSAHDAEIRRDLAKAGYSGEFACKKGRACDGSAIFWKRSRLQTASQPTILNLGSVFVALAQPLILDNKWHLTAVATHLKAGLAKGAEATRTSQAESLLWQLWEHENVILLADLNAHCRPWLDDQKEEVKPQAYPLLSTELSSAYKAVLGDEPGFTSWGGWAGRDVRAVFDYVLFRGEIFTAARVLNVPAYTDLLEYPERMPNDGHPSDHLPMVADFFVEGAGQGRERYAKRPRRW